MGARWMEQKKLKQRKERRAWARPFTVKSGIQPNRDVIRQYQDTAKGLGKLIAEVRFPNVAPGRKEIMDRIATVGDPLHGIVNEIPDPFFVTIVDTPIHRCRCYYDSRRTLFILQLVEWKDKVYRLSFTYPDFTTASRRWHEGKVKWKLSKPFPSQ